MAFSKVYGREVKRLRDRALGVNRPDTQADIDERTRYETIRVQVLAEISERFPTIAAENFEEANQYRERRISELREGGSR